VQFSHIGPQVASDVVAAAHSLDGDDSVENISLSSADSSSSSASSSSPSSSSASAASTDSDDAAASPPSLAVASVKRMSSYGVLGSVFVWKYSNAQVLYSHALARTRIRARKQYPLRFMSVLSFPTFPCLSFCLSVLDVCLLCLLLARADS
jgi:hypothetical protein